MQDDNTNLDHLLDENIMEQDDVVNVQWLAILKELVLGYMETRIVEVSDPDGDASFAATIRWKGTPTSNSILSLSTNSWNQ